MRSIGEMARATGLTASALRFYDSAGVLVPARVDPVTGYRHYADEQLKPARVLASLRRVGMPLAEVVRVLGALGDPAAAEAVLAAHLGRLEAGLADARTELSRVSALLRPEEPLMPTITCSNRDLTVAIDAVRFAVGRDPALPALAGVLVEVEDGLVRLVATDRFRLATATATGVADGAGSALAPATFLDEARALAAGDGSARLTVGPEIVLETAAGRAAAPALDLPFPDYRRLTGGGSGRRVAVDPAAVRATLAAAPTVARTWEGVDYEATVLTVDDAGRLAAAAPDAWTEDGAAVAVNREFLLQALDAGGPGQLELELDGPIRPLAVRSAGGFSILMPVRL
ncbi:hypothetical protein Sya03_32530 [Spirilliplanes yamanashiensis]|uniref:HTH merR-type domain-containing protein n=2 Tax=Spirilliplanes yamanashiensis TaxID=42233 RepID=A0A8J3Y8F0_9ACTN|nr:hypothetical protein Sya03_32530 [Spirilliplanes yamanashiensis]